VVEVEQTKAARPFSLVSEHQLSGSCLLVSLALRLT